MPYLAHFAFATEPFGLTPNTQCYFPTAHNTHILQSLQYAARARTGILKVVGDVGTGKTMLCRMLLRALLKPEAAGEASEAAVAYLNAPQADGHWLLAALCLEFGLSGRGSRAELMRRLNDFLLARHAEGRPCIVVVDEAQALGVEGLETIRLLSNLETETAKLLHIVLLGQPELDALLERRELRQLIQRIAFAFNTQPLAPAEAVSYLQHRVRCARLPGLDFPVFDRRALTLLAKASRGVPRVLNILADKTLLIAYGEGATPATVRHVEQAVQDSRPIARIGRPRRPWGRWALWGSVALEVAALVAILVVNPELPGKALAAARALAAGGAAHVVPTDPTGDGPVHASPAAGAASTKPAADAAEAPAAPAARPEPSPPAAAAAPQQPRESLPLTARPTTVAVPDADREADSGASRAPAPAVQSPPSAAPPKPTPDDGDAPAAAADPARGARTGALAAPRPSVKPAPPAPARGPAAEPPIPDPLPRVAEAGPYPPTATRTTDGRWRWE